MLIVGRGSPASLISRPSAERGLQLSVVVYTSQTCIEPLPMLKALGKPFRRKSRDGERPAEAQTPPGYRSPSARQGGFIHGGGGGGSRGARGLGATGARVPSRLQFEQQGGGGEGGGGGGSPRNGRSPGGNAIDSSDSSAAQAVPKGRGRRKSRADDDEWVLQEALNEYVGRKRWLLEGQRRTSG